MSVLNLLVDRGESVPTWQGLDTGVTVPLDTLDPTAQKMSTNVKRIPVSVIMEYAGTLWEASNVSVGQDTQALCVTWSSMSVSQTHANMATARI